jgi:hypothetical protein
MFRVGVLLTTGETKGINLETKPEVDEYILMFMLKGVFKKAYIEDLTTGQREVVNK